jgi:hypothetical protein
MDATTQATASARDDMAAQLGRLQNDMNALKETVADFGKAPGANGACSCAACSAAASQLAKHAKAEVQSMLADVETFVRQNLRYVLGGALGLGLVLGLKSRRH